LASPWASVVHAARAKVSAIVLLDDNFRTIVQAIAEGRQLFRNLQLSFQYILEIHIHWSSRRR
jgi:magnesium-transporting ATPase (P-type)